MKILPKKVAVIYNELTEDVDDDVHLSDQDTVTTANEVCEALKVLGYEVKLKEVKADRIKDLAKLKCDLVFNQCEWLGKNIDLDCEVIMTLEKNGIAYTGATAKNYYETANKIAFKKKMSALGLPTPAWVVMNDENDYLEGLKYPLIVKPVYEHGSIGLSQESVVTDEKVLRNQVIKIIKKYEQPVLVEEFVAGKELNITVVGDVVLPITEMEFGPLFPGRWNILTFYSKFFDRSSEFRETNAIYPPKGVEGVDLRKLERLARVVYEKLGCRDYARFDMRLTREGEPFILEVNSNPSLENARIASVVAAEAYGWSYEELIGRIVTAAWKRYEDTREVGYQVVA